MEKEKLGMLKETHASDLKRLELSNELASRTMNSRVNLLSSQARQADLAADLTESNLYVAAATEESKITSAQADAVWAVARADNILDEGKRNRDKEKERLDNNKNLQAARSRIIDLRQEVDAGEITPDEFRNKARALGINLTPESRAGLLRFIDGELPAIVAKTQNTNFIEQLTKLDSKQLIIVNGQKPQDRHRVAQEMDETNKLIKRAEGWDVDAGLLEDIKNNSYFEPTPTSGGPFGQETYNTVDTWDNGQLTPQGKNLIFNAIKAKKSLLGPVSKVEQTGSEPPKKTYDLQAEKKAALELVRAGLEAKNNKETLRINANVDIMKSLIAQMPKGETVTHEDRLEWLRTAQTGSPKLTAHATIPIMPDINELESGDLFWDMNDQGQIRLDRKPPPPEAQPEGGYTPAVDDAIDTTDTTSDRRGLQVGENKEYWQHVGDMTDSFGMSEKNAKNIYQFATHPLRGLWDADRTTKENLGAVKDYLNKEALLINDEIGRLHGQAGLVDMYAKGGREGLMPLYRKLSPYFGKSAGQWPEEIVFDGHRKVKLKGTAEATSETERYLKKYLKHVAAVKTINKALDKK